MGEDRYEDRIWFVVQNGQRVLLLEDPKQEDMFWYSFRTVGLVPNGLDVDLKGIWEGNVDVEDPRSGYRYGGVIAGGVRPLELGDRVSLRGLVVATPPPQKRSWRWWKRAD